MNAIHFSESSQVGFLNNSCLKFHSSFPFWNVKTLFYIDRMLLFYIRHITPIIIYVSYILIIKSNFCPTTDILKHC